MEREYELYEITATETATVVYYVRAESESAARQAFIDGEHDD